MSSRQIFYNIRTEVTDHQDNFALKTCCHRDLSKEKINNERNLENKYGTTVLEEKKRTYTCIHDTDFLACLKGFHGQNCTLTCNDKCDGCHNVDGSCKGGCIPGWKGENCQQRM